MSLFCWCLSVDIFNILPGFLRQPLLRHQRLLTCKQLSNLERSSLQLKLCFLRIDLYDLYNSLRSWCFDSRCCFRVSRLIHFRHREMRFTANQVTWNKFPSLYFFYSALRASVALRATCRTLARIWLAVIDFQNGEQSRSGSDKKRRNRLQ